MFFFFVPGTQLVTRWQRHSCVNWAGAFQTFSAGLEPKELNPHTVRVMEEAEFDISAHRSKGIEDYLGKERFHFMVTVCHGEKDNCPRVWPGVHNRLHWSFEDLAAIDGTEDEKLEKFRQVRDQIREKIAAWLNEIALFNVPDDFDMSFGNNDTGS